MASSGGERGEARSGVGKAWKKNPDHGERPRAIVPLHIGVKQGNSSPRPNDARGTLDSLRRTADDSQAGMNILASITSMLYERRFARNRDQNLFRGVFDSAEAAARSVPVRGVVGYDNEASAKLYDYHLVRIFPHDYAAIYWLGRSFDHGLASVLDIGGHIGIKYYAFQKYLQYPAALRWQVCDVPSVIARGKEIAAERDRTGRLSFVGDPRQAAPCDLLFLSGSVQYLPYGLDELLDGLARLPARVVINTTPVHPERTFFTLNSIGTAFCPYRVHSEQELLAAFTGKGYKLQDHWQCPGKPMHIPGYPEHSLDHYSGYCLDRLGE